MFVKKTASSLIIAVIALASAGTTLRATTESPDIIWHNRANTNWAGALAFTPDGTYLVSGGRDKQIHIWRTSDGALVRTLEGHTGVVSSVAISPNGKLVASESESDDGSVRLWNFTDGTLIRRSAFSYPREVRFSPDGTFLGITDNGGFEIYKVADGTLVRTFDHGGFSQDGRWRISSEYIGTGSYDPLAYETSVWQNSGESYWVSSDETLRLSIPWQVGTLSPDSSLLLATTSGFQDNPLGSTLSLYRVAGGTELPTLTFPQRGAASNPITWIDGRGFSPDNELVGAISASTRVFDPGPYLYIAFWRVSTGELIKYYRENGGVPAYGTTPLVFSPDGQFFAYTRGEGTVVLARSPGSPPVLSVEQNQNQALVSWTTPTITYILEFSQSLDSNAVWTAVDTLPVPIGTKQVVSVDLTATARFFRLRRP